MKTENSSSSLAVSRHGDQVRVQRLCIGDTFDMGPVEARRWFLAGLAVVDAIESKGPSGSTAREAAPTPMTLRDAAEWIASQNPPPPEMAGDATFCGAALHWGRPDDDATKDVLYTVESWLAGPGMGFGFITATRSFHAPESLDQHEAAAWFLDAVKTAKAGGGR